MTKGRRILALFSLILAGEAVFFLPFVLPRIFRPTYLDVFGITNLELGSLYSVYGVVAVFSYFLGGPIADRFKPHKLMSCALLLTAAGGVYLTTIPSFGMLQLLFAFWGCTTILLFWAALMRVTRVLGGVGKQGMAFGLLDGGRGAVAALVGASAVWLLAFLLPITDMEVSAQDQTAAFQRVILLFTVVVVAAALIIFFALRVDEGSTDSYRTSQWTGIKEVLSNKAVWLQALIIVCAYSGYRVTDDISLMVKNVLGYDEVKAAAVSTLALWLRPVAAVGAGLMADRISPSQMIRASFIMLFFAGGLMIFIPHLTGSVVIISTVIITTCLGVYALRGLYFAIMEEGGIPILVTGTVVGVASVVGYLPDIYMAPLMGYFLDTYPGADGHRWVFGIMAGFAIIGFIATSLFRSHLSIKE